jgi:hypothetical protein
MLQAVVRAGEVRQVHAHRSPRPRQRSQHGRIGSFLRPIQNWLQGFSRHKITFLYKNTGDSEKCNFAKSIFLICVRDFVSIKQPKVQGKLLIIIGVKFRIM